MMRSLWTSASGMSAQMLKIDTVTNNMANVNTTGFKRERVEFQSLLYETIQRANMDPANMTGRPVNLQVGHGVRSSGTTRMFSQGPLQRTDRPADFAIEGSGFFQVRRSPDEYFFTRDGSFHLMPQEDGTLILATAAGFPVISVDGEEIILQEGVTMNNLTVQDSGMLLALIDDELEDLGIQIRLVQFPNPNGMEAVGGNLLLKQLLPVNPCMR